MYFLESSSTVVIRIILLRARTHSSSSSRHLASKVSKPWHQISHKRTIYNPSQRKPMATNSLRGNRTSPAKLATPGRSESAVSRIRPRTSGSCRLNLRKHRQRKRYKAINLTKILAFFFFLHFKQARNYT